MMESAQDWNCGNRAEPLSAAQIRRILVQREMCPNPIVIGSVILQNATQLRFAEHDEVVEAFAPNRFDESLDVAVLPR